MVVASSVGEAEKAMLAAGLTIRSIVAADAGDVSDFPAASSTAQRASGPEEVVWQGGPSQWTNAGWFAACLLILPIPIAIWKAIELRNTAFILTSQRIKLEKGVLSKQYDQVELYRVKDTILTRSLIQRALGLGTIKMITSDPNQPELDFPSIPDAEHVRELIRQNVERMRRLRGVRELDVADEAVPSAFAN